MAVGQVERSNGYSGVAPVPTRAKWQPAWLQKTVAPITPAPAEVDICQQPKVEISQPPVTSQPHWTVYAKPNLSMLKKANDRGYSARVKERLADDWNVIFWTTSQTSAEQLLTQYKAKAKQTQEFRIVAPGDSMEQAA